MQYHIHIPAPEVRAILLHIVKQRVILLSSAVVSGKLVKSGHVNKPVSQLRGTAASHVGVFDFSSMTASLQEERFLPTRQITPDTASAASILSGNARAFNQSC